MREGDTLDLPSTVRSRAEELLRWLGRIQCVVTVHGKTHLRMFITLTLSLTLDSPFDYPCPRAFLVVSRARPYTRAPPRTAA